jgi:Rieske Fe-S protein
MRPEIGDVAARTAYVRYNGLLEGEPSFTILSNRCVHLGCPVQANGPTTPEARRTYLQGARQVTFTPVLPAGGFGCPCHGGQYSAEGNRVAGPPVRALDRWAYKVADGRLRLIGAYSVDEVDGSGADATMGSYRLAQPGVHIDGLSQVLYPFIPPS